MNLVAFYSISLQTQTQTAGKTIDALCIIRDSPVANRVKVKTVSAGFLKCWVRVMDKGIRYFRFTTCIPSSRLNNMFYVTAIPD